MTISEKVAYLKGLAEGLDLDTTKSKEGKLISVMIGIMEELAAAGKGWQKNTVITLLSRLVEKGLLRTSKIGRRNEYTALVTEAEYQTAQTRLLLNKLYQGDARGLVLTLLRQDLFSAGDYEELREFWEKERDK